MNRYPYNNGHVMVVPYTHTSSPGKLTDTANLEIMKAVARCMMALHKNSAPDGFNLGANIGKTAGAGIEKHVHFHLVPRWNGDTNFMPLLSEVKVVSENLQKSCSVLKRLLNH
jgi:ATP adenylyltransferase